MDFACKPVISAHGHVRCQFTSNLDYVGQRQMFPHSPKCDSLSKQTKKQKRPKWCTCAGIGRPRVAFKTNFVTIAHLGSLFVRVSGHVTRHDDIAELVPQILREIDQFYEIGLTRRYTSVG